MLYRNDTITVADKMAAQEKGGLDLAGAAALNCAAALAIGFTIAGYDGAEAEYNEQAKKMLAARGKAKATITACIRLAKTAADDMGRSMIYRDNIMATDANVGAVLAMVLNDWRARHADWLAEQPEDQAKKAAKFTYDNVRRAYGLLASKAADNRTRGQKMVAALTADGAEDKFTGQELRAILDAAKTLLTTVETREKNREARVEHYATRALQDGTASDDLRDALAAMTRLLEQDAAEQAAAAA